MVTTSPDHGCPFLVLPVSRIETIYPLSEDDFTRSFDLVMAQWSGGAGSRGTNIETMQELQQLHHEWQMLQEQERRVLMALNRPVPPLPLQQLNNPDDITSVKRQVSPAFSTNGYAACSLVWRMTLHDY